jgi:transketolase
MATIAELKSKASQVRRDIVRMVHAQSSGHPGGSLGCTEIFVSLFDEVMDHDTSFNMDAKGEDMFFLSNGHISPVYYSTLARAGYFPIDELNTFRTIDSRLQGHPATHEGLEGIRVATGSLGQGVSVAIGAAMAKKMNGDDKTVYALTGDGELQEGQIWEAVMYAAHNKIDNLVVAVDYNQIQIDGRTTEVMDADLPWGPKFEAFGWNVIDCKGGNDFEQVLAAYKQAQSNRGSGKPTVIIMHTIIGKGVDFMEDSNAWHGNAPSDEQLATALAQLEETQGDY